MSKKQEAYADDGYENQGELKINISGLSKFFGQVRAVHNISFQVRVGEILGVMGPNGAGKTTTMRMIAGFMRPSAGKIELDGINVSDRPLKTKKLLGYLPEGAPLWHDMTPLYLLRFAARTRGLSALEANHAIARTMELAELNEVANQPIATLSKGFRRRVGLAQAIFHDPPILVLDEPTDGLDPTQKRQVRQLIRSMAETKAIIISTHILEEVEPLCTRVLIMNKGKILVDETPALFAARSNYSNAVSVRMAKRNHRKLLELFQNNSSIRHIEISIKMNEVLITFFPSAQQQAEKLAQSIRKAATDNQIPLRALIVEGGRLEDVFYNLTTQQPAPPPSKQKKKI